MEPQVSEENKALQPLQGKDGPPQSDHLLLNPDEDTRKIMQVRSEQFQSLNHRERSPMKTSVELSEARDRTDIPLSTRRFILITFLSSTFFINVEMGSIPAALLSI